MIRTDEHGEIVARGEFTPLWVLTPEQDERWEAAWGAAMRVCLGNELLALFIAHTLYGQPAPGDGVNPFAGAPQPKRVAVEEAYTWAERLHPRDRRGRFRERLWAAMTPKKLKAMEFETPQANGSLTPKEVFDGSTRNDFESLADVVKRAGEKTVDGENARFQLKFILGLDNPQDEARAPVGLYRSILRDEPIQLFRAIPLDEPNHLILPGAYVSESHLYAALHGEGPLNGRYRVLSVTARPSELLSRGDPHEWLWAPKDAKEALKQVQLQARTADEDDWLAKLATPQTPGSQDPAPTPADAPDDTPLPSWDELKALGLMEWPTPGPDARKLLDREGVEYRNPDKPNTKELYHDPGATPQHPGSLAAVGHKGRPLYPAYSAERQQRHDEIVADALVPVISALPGIGPDHPIVRKLRSGGWLTPADAKEIRKIAKAARGGHNPVVLFSAGGPASGKTTFLDNHPELLPVMSVQANADHVREKLPEYQILLAKGDHYAAEAVHDEAGDIVERITDEAMKCGLNLVWDGVGNKEPGTKDDPGTFVQSLMKKAEKGYGVDIVYVDTDTVTSIQRDVKRAREKGRFVPVPHVRDTHPLVSRVYRDEVSTLQWLDGLRIYSNGELVAYRDEDGGLVPVNVEAYNAFLAKADEHIVLPGEEPIQEAAVSEEPGDELAVPLRDASGKVAPEHWSIERPYDFDPDRLPPVYAGRTDGLSGPPLDDDDDDQE